MPERIIHIFRTYVFFSCLFSLIHLINTCQKFYVSYLYLSTPAVISGFFTIKHNHANIDAKKHLGFHFPEKCSQT